MYPNWYDADKDLKSHKSKTQHHATKGAKGGYAKYGDAYHWDEDAGEDYLAESFDGLGFNRQGKNTKHKTAQKSKKSYAMADDGSQVYSHDESDLLKQLQDMMTSSSSASSKSKAKGKKSYKSQGYAHDEDYYHDATGPSSKRGGSKASASSARKGNQDYEIMDKLNRYFSRKQGSY